jgi:uroporphyrinogen-III decarboxylase
MKMLYTPNRLRFEAAAERIRSTYLHQRSDRLPLVIADVNCALCCEQPSLIPDDYFTNPGVMCDYQLGKMERHLRQFDDDYIPVLIPWFGTGVIPSALGCEILFQPKLDPAVGQPVLKEPADIGKLSLPNPYKDGLMPRVLHCIDHMRASSDVAVSVTDTQGPLNIALCLCGLETLCFWMSDHPQAMHELMEFCAEALIQWVKVQKKHAGQELSSGAFPHGLFLPKGFGGVSISDDDCVVLSAKLYREFVVPYNSKVLRAFGGGTLHFCGTAEHQIGNFLQTEGLTGINNFCMGNFRQIRKMQEAFAGRLAVMACDFTPLDIEQYSRGMLEAIDSKGIILATFVSPEFGLLADGKYKQISRDGGQLALESAEILSRLVGQSSQIPLLKGVA